jgi:hypothetical protein
VLEDEVAIEQDRLYPREQRIVLVDVAPARLDHTDLRVGEMMNRTEEELGRRYEIGVENGDELAGRVLHPHLERARLEPAAVGPVVVLDI